MIKEHAKLLQAMAAVVAIVVAIITPLWKMSFVVYETKSTLDERTGWFEVFEERQKMGIDEIHLIRQQMMSVVYVANDYVLVRLFDGDEILIPYDPDLSKMTEK